MPKKTTKIIVQKFVFKLLCATFVVSVRHKTPKTPTTMKSFKIEKDTTATIKVWQTEYINGGKVESLATVQFTVPAGTVLMMPTPDTGTHYLIDPAGHVWRGLSAMWARAAVAEILRQNT
jgi:hypothetical protein